MSDTTWHFLKNQFNTATATSYKKANILNNDHMGKLTAENTDADIAALEARTQPLSTDFSDKYSTWISAKATSKGYTQVFDNLLSELSSTKIKQWDIQIQGVHLEGTAEYTMILPNRRRPFQTGGKDERLSEVQALAQRLLSYPALAATQADVDAFATSMQTARNNQQQKEELVAMASDQLEQARVALTTMMYGNLGVLMDKYRTMPGMIENFWQLDLIRTTSSAADDDVSLPSTQVTISGRLTDSVTLQPIVGATVTMYAQATGPGGDQIEVFTDANGNYQVTIEDLPSPTTVGIEAKSSSYMPQTQTLNLEPGNNYININFSLSQTP